MNISLAIDTSRAGLISDRRQFCSRKQRTISIGRRRGCDVPVDDPQASYAHAMIELCETGAILRDLGSTAGTWLDGKRVSKARLERANCVQIGETVLRVTVAQGAEPITLSEIDVREHVPSQQRSADALAAERRHRITRWLHELEAPELDSIEAYVAFVRARPTLPPPLPPMDASSLKAQSATPTADLFSTPNAGAAKAAPAMARQHCSPSRLVASLRAGGKRRERGLAMMAALLLFTAFVATVLATSTTPHWTAGNPAEDVSMETVPQISETTLEMEVSDAADTPTEVVYVVRRGDTLGSIARVLLGDATRWQELFYANRDALSDPSQLDVGTRLRLVPRHRGFD